MTFLPQDADGPDVSASSGPASLSRGTVLTLVRLMSWRHFAGNCNGRRIKGFQCKLSYSLIIHIKIVYKFSYQLCLSFS